MGAEGGVGRAQAQGVQAPLRAGAPVARCRPRSGVQVHRLHLQPAKRLAAQLEAVGHHVERRDARGRLGQQRGGLVVLAVGDDQPRQARHHGAGCARRAFAVGDAAGQLARAYVGAPAGALARAGGTDLVQRAAVHHQLAGVQRQAVRQVGAQGIVVARALAGDAGDGGLPGIDVDARQVGPGQHAGSRQRQPARALGADTHGAAQHARAFGARGVQLELGAQHVGHAGTHAVAGVDLAQLHAQRPGRGLRLGQRLGQIEAEAAQVGADLDLRLRAAEAQHCLIVRAAAGLARQRRHRAPVGHAAQAFGAGVAAHAHLHRRGAGGAALGAHAAAAHAGLAAQHAGAGVADGEAGVGELHAALRRRQPRAAGRKLDVVAGQLHAALDLGVVDVVHRQIERQLEAGRAAARGIVQRVLGQQRHRRIAHDAQRRRQRPLAFGLHGDAGVAQVGDAGLDLRELPARVVLHPGVRAAHAHAVALEDQLAAEFGQGRPGRLVPGLDGTGHVVHHHVRHLAGEAELARRRVLVERHLGQVAADAHRHIACVALGDGIAHVVARVGRDAERQVAMHACAVGTAELSLQIEHARKALARRRAGLPADLELARGVGVGELQALQRHLDVLALHLPAGVGAQALQWNARLLEHPGKLQRALADRQCGVAAGRRGVQVQVGAFNSWYAGMGHWPVRRLARRALAGPGGQRELP